MKSALFFLLHSSFRSPWPTVLTVLMFPSYGSGYVGIRPPVRLATFVPRIRSTTRPGIPRRNNLTGEALCAESF
jgi:hypothetical protein